MAQRLLLLAGGVLLVFLTSCDTVSNDDESILLPPKVEELRFEFRSDDIETGQLVDLVAAGDPINLGPFLQSNGYSKNDVVAATVEAARLEVLFPLSESADFLSKAIVKLQTTSLSALEVASLDNFPASRRVDVPVLVNRNIASIVQAPDDFNVILQIEAQDLEPLKDYELGLELTLRIEVEGL